MSQSASLYRVSQEIFKQLNKPDNKQEFDINSAKSYSTFQGTFIALVYILCKGQEKAITELICEIFNPKYALGKQEFDSLTGEEQFEFYYSGRFIPYLGLPTISKLNDFIVTVSQTDIHLKYDAKEFNENDIYPEVWHNDNSPDQAYNERHILEDFEKLKTIIIQADQEKDFIFVYVG